MHVIIYVLDALRADHLGCYGYSRPTSPHIDALARDGIVFENCFTATTWTRPVAASLLSGVYPGVHRTRTRTEMFSAAIPRLPELLAQGGFRSAAFVTMGNIGRDIGFGRGFDEYHDLFRDPAILGQRRRLDAVAAAMLHARDEEMALPRAEDINPPLFRWLEAQGAASTFSFIWSIEPHVPYDPPPGYRRFAPPERIRPNEGEQDDIRAAGAADRQRLMALYDDEIAYNDACLGQITDYLKAHNLFDDTLFVVLGDHGEAFYEHEVYAHGHAPFDEVIHVPLIIKLPGQAQAGARVAALTELIDVLPTVLAGAGLDLATLSPDHPCQGHNLLSLAAGQLEAVRDYVFSDTQALEVHNRYLSIRDMRWKYIQMQLPPRDRGTLLTTARHVIERRLVWKILRSPRHFLRNYFRPANAYLFDLSRDPQEQHNLIEAQPTQADALRQQLAEWVTHNELLASNTSVAPQDIEENDLLAQHLERLGYL